MTVATPLVDWTVTVVILVTISTIAISLRILAINVRKVGLKIPDYLLFISYTCQIGYLIDVCYYGTLIARSLDALNQTVVLNDE